MNLISKLNERRMALASKKRKGFTMVEMVIVIVIIAVLMAALIPTFATVVQNAQTSAATQAMKSSYEAIKAYDLHDNGYLDSAANGVIVYKASDTTKGYYAVVTNGEMGDVYIMEQLATTATASALTDGTNTNDIVTLSGNLSSDATSAITSTKSETVVTFTWNNEGFSGVTSVGKVVNTGTAPDVNDDVMDGMIADVTDNVCFYSIGEGSVTATTGTAKLG